MKVAHTLKKWKQGRCRKISCMKITYILNMLKKWGIGQKKPDSLVYDKVLTSNVKTWSELKSSKVGVLLNTVNVCSVALEPEAFNWFPTCVIWLAHAFILCHPWEFGTTSRKHSCLISSPFFLAVYVECHCGEYIIPGDRHKPVRFALQWKSSSAMKTNPGVHGGGYTTIILFWRWKEKNKPYIIYAGLSMSMSMSMSGNYWILIG